MLYTKNIIGKDDTCIFNGSFGMSNKVSNCNLRLLFCKGEIVSRYILINGITSS